jgi:hypothetical protein
MNRPDFLKKSARSYSRVWSEFIRAFKKDSGKFYCFFEGKYDIKYYGIRIDNALRYTDEGAEWCHFWCDGKPNLLSLFELIMTDERYQSAWVAFFVDRDFDDPECLPNTEKLYVTPCYSIENLYVTESAFARILRTEFSIREIDPEWKSTCNLYHTQLQAFNDASTELNAWIMIQREHERQKPGQTKLNLNNAEPQKLFTVTLTDVTKDYTIDDLEEYCKCETVDRTAIQRKITDIQVNEYNRTLEFRGKYLIHFLERFLRCLLNDINRKTERVHFSERHRTRLKISGNSIAELSGYADTPPCLVTFLQDQLAAQSRQLSYPIQVSEST